MKLAIVPVPEFPNPTTVLSFTQEYTVPFTVPLNATAFVAELKQIV